MPELVVPLKLVVVKVHCGKWRLTLGKKRIWERLHLVQFVIPVIGHPVRVLLLARNPHAIDIELDIGTDFVVFYALGTEIPPEELRRDIPAAPVPVFRLKIINRKNPKGEKEL